MPTVNEAINVLAQHYNIEPGQIHRVLSAYAEGRVKIGRKYPYETCGTCQNFDRTPCKASGYCTKRKRKTHYHGETDQPLPVTQSRLCCTDYIPKEGVVSGDSEPVAEPPSAESAI